MRRGGRLGIEAMASPSCDQNRPELVHDWSKSKNGGKDCVLELCSWSSGLPGEAVSASVRALRPSPRALTGPTRASYPRATSGALWLRISHVSTRTGAFERRLQPPAVLRAPLGRPHRCAARSRSSAIPVYHVVRRATATRAAERPESFAAPRKRSGTLPRTSLSGARSTNTLDMLLLGPSRRPHAPVDWTGRANAPAGLDLRPPGSRRRAAAHCARGGRHHHPDFPRVLAPRPFSHARGVG